MTSTPLHPQARAHLDNIEGAPGFHEMTVAEARLSGLGFLTMQRPAPEMAAVEHRFVPGPTADLPIRILRPVPASTPQPAVVVLHGSGFVTCNLDMVDQPARQLASDTGFVVVTVNYQKAPEHPFPIPLDDSQAALRWVHDHADELGIDPSRLAVLGDSAGGNLAAAVAQWAGSAGIPLAAQALLYPVLDHARDTGSYAEFATGAGLGAADMAWFWDHYLPDDSYGDDVRASPGRASDLAGLPPTFVAAASHDVLRDEALSYARRVAAAGVDVKQSTYDGMIHGFWWMDAVLDPARDLQRDVAAWLVSTLDGAGWHAPEGRG